MFLISSLTSIIMNESLNKKLDTHRFVLSENQESREQLKKFKKEFAGLKKEYPELAACTVFGSQTKGYATEKSDLDVSVYLDTDKFPKGSDVYELAKIEEEATDDNELWFENSKASDSRPHTTERFYLMKKYRSLVKEKVEKSGFPKSDIFLTPISRERIRKTVDYLIKNPERKHPPLDIAMLFGLSLHPDIKYYRELIIKEIENQSKNVKINPDECWHKIIYELRTWGETKKERIIPIIGLPFTEFKERAANLYPQTIKKAKEKYLK